ncbi:Auxilin-related 2 [Micractinium conductrix]|uniref:Auxilin-related 2 n=1 Tax=Micractinium conductrix TaxID=554055 RepID=A0A2P6VIY9_9CHLO|nr:Auxilin-related 2 [Micractinium conductrix]|eukprot:PSC74042.1 Auxilin-related 2 [Micractinium conductrix]
MAGQGTPGDGGLGDLLASVAPQFQKRSLADMKKSAPSGTPVQASAGGAVAVAPRSSGLPSNGSTSSRPGPPTGPDAFGLDALDSLTKPGSSPSLAAQRTAAASGSSGSLTGLGGAGSRPATGGASAGSGSASAFDNLLGGLGPAGRGGTSMRASSAAPSPSKPPPAAPAAAAATAKPPMPPAAAPAFTPSPPPAAAFAAMPEPQGPPPAADEDPFALFGGPPPPAAAASGPSFGGSTTVAIPVASVDDGFLDAFAASPLPAPQQAVQASASASRQQVAAAAAAAAAAVDDADHFGDFKASEDSEVPRSQATAPAPAPRQAAGTAGGSSSFSGRPGAPAGGPTSTFGFERQPAGGAPRYRVFDFVEGEADGASAAGAAPAGAAGTARPGSRSSSLGSGQAADPHHFREQGAAASASAGPALPRTGPLGSGAPAGGGGGGVLHAGRYGQQQQAGTKEVVTDLGHKAAKALQTGTKWFMRASKTLVSQVQQKLEHPHGGPQGRASTAQPGGPLPYHYDWAAQLSRASPGSRATALEAMAEEDRLAVQRVLDEAVLGDSFMEGPGYEGIAPPAGGSGQQQQQPQAEAEAAREGSGRSTDGRAGSAAGSADAAVGRSSSSRPSPAAGAVAGGAGGARARAAAQLPAYEALFSGDRPAAAAPAQRQQQAQQQAQPQARPQAGAAPGEDLLGMASANDRQAAAAAAATAVGAGDDLLGFGGAPPSRQGSLPHSAASSTAHIENLFTVPASKPATAALAGGGRTGSSVAPLPRPAAAARAASASGLDSMIDLGASLPAVDTQGFDELYADADADGDANEPEVRRALRQRRIQEKHERMQRQLAEKRARDNQEEAEKSGKVEFRSQLKPKIDGWAAGKKDNIRALLASLHTVMWEGSGWSQPSMADMVEAGKVKRAYMKANLVVHPDKVKQKGGTLEQVATADMVFDVLKAAWGKFEAAER